MSERKDHPSKGVTSAQARGFKYTNHDGWGMLQVDIEPVPDELRDALLQHLLGAVHVFLAENNVIEDAQVHMKTVTPKGPLQ